MHLGKKVSPAEVDFWLDTEKYDNFVEEGLDPSKGLVFNIDMVRLASIRSAVANFVRILTRKSIPVYFCNAPTSFNLDGRQIYISAKITTKREFDVAVGLSLHEAAHTLLTDFGVIRHAYQNIPKNIYKMSDAKNIRRASMEKFIHGMWNVIEDRYVDSYIFNSAPGYRGYYAAMYEELWNSPQVDMFLLSDECKYPSLKSYDFRITNFTNENTDLMALPRLDDIARIIDISHIDRLTTTRKRIEAAFEVTEVVLECIDKQQKFEAAGGIPAKKKILGLANPSEYFDFGDEDSMSGDGSEKTPDKKGKIDGHGSDEEEPKDVGTEMVKEISDIITGKNPHPEKLKENEKAVKQTSDESPDAKDTKQLDAVMEQQRKFLIGDVSKEQVTEYQKALLDLIEKHGIVIVQVDVPIVVSGNDTCFKVDCIVVHKMTKELVLSGDGMFPLSGVMKMGKTTPEPPQAVAEAVKKGILLGSKLGRKLQIRAEDHPITIVRKKYGKINRRILHEAAFDSEDLFKKIQIERHPEANLHITVDASSSMNGQKWYRTMTSVVAICKAASMVDNIHITVSFRSTQTSTGRMLPYIVLAYDSKVDKFSKIRTLFPYLVPSGCTPEGLAFGATMSLFEGITPDEEERYFLNLSDGEPYFTMTAPDSKMALGYHGDVGANHTKTQVDKIRRLGVDILSYFIEEDYGHPTDVTPPIKTKSLNDNPKRALFRKMYGPSAKFIRVDEITDLAKTLNELFLNKSKLR
jgi:NAD(P)H-hydrate repair Nnr-like enzyme with NAD(P)H-hydrate epimerase domain